MDYPMTVEQTNPDGGDTEKNWKDKNIGSLISALKLYRYFSGNAATDGFPENVGIVFGAVFF